MAKEILTPLQKEFIRLFAINKILKEQFYLTGGTALAEYYLRHRLSEDLDFFSGKEIDLLAINIFLKETRAALKLKDIDFQQSFNRNIFFLRAQKETLKLEFTYFPFEQAERPVNKGGIFVDSITDIAANKVFTIFQAPRGRDFIDVYCIINKYKRLSFSKLTKMARIKFDVHIDPIQLGTQLVKAKTARDLPRMIEKVDDAEWRSFFIKQAKLLSRKILK